MSKLTELEQVIGYEFNEQRLLAAGADTQFLCK